MDKGFLGLGVIHLYHVVIIGGFAIIAILIIEAWLLWAWDGRPKWWKRGRRS